MSQYNRFYRLSVQRAINIGLYIHSSSNYNYFEDTVIGHGSTIGVYTRAGTRELTMNGIRVYNNNGRGLYLRSCTKCVLRDVVSFNNNGQGIYVYEGAPDTTFTNVLVTNNSQHGFLSTQPRTTVQNITAAGNQLAGIYLSSGGNTLVQAVAVNNNGDGLYLASDNNLISQLVVLNNGGNGVRIGTSNENVFTGSLKAGNNALGDCAVDAGTNAGLNNTCGSTHSASNFVLTAGLSGAVMFKGKITSSDIENSDVLNGLIAQDKQTNWALLGGFYRTVGPDGSTFPSADNRNYCSSGQCRIWDWSLSGSDAIAKDINGVFTTGSACPQATTQTVTDSHSSPRVFYPAGFEILHSKRNNGNGLCEAGEDCVFVPDMGVSNKSLMPVGECQGEAGGPSFSY